MKKLLIIVFIAVLASACKKDKEEPAPFQVADYPIELVGEWKLLGIEYNNDWIYVRDTMTWVTVYDRNGTYVTLQLLEKFYSENNGTWEKTSNNVFKTRDNWAESLGSMKEKIIYLISYEGSILHVGEREMNFNDKEMYKQEYLWVRIK
jgi:hypothetical protein